MHFILFHSEKIIAAYKGELPLSHTLRNYTKQHKQLGSKDRKSIAHCVYSWYRCAKFISNAKSMHFEEQMHISLWLCKVIPLIHLLPAYLQATFELSIYEKIKFASQNNIAIDLATPANFKSIELSKNISYASWIPSLFEQPLVFIRTLGPTTTCTSLLTAAQINFEVIDTHCIAVNNASAIDQILPKELYVIQDYASQKTGNFLDPKNGESWLDCCCGAGGKSLLLASKKKQITHHVMDVRASILHNLQDRFRTAKLKAPIPIIVDITDAMLLKQKLGNLQFDHIICDVPCSGSGTWARTPEQFYFFNSKELSSFNAKQFIIANNSLAYLKEGGTLIYITCSIFQSENEAIIASLLQHNPKIICKEMHLINGIENKADCMFVAVLERPLEF